MKKIRLNETQLRNIVTECVKRVLNEASWGIYDSDLREIEMVDDKDWEHFSMYAFCALNDKGHNEPVYISGYAYDPHGVLGRSYASSVDKIGSIYRTRSTTDVFVKNVSIVSRWDTAYGDLPTPTRWPKIKVGKMWGEHRFELVGLTENGENIYCRFQWERD